MLSISDIPPETNWRCKKFQFHPLQGQETCYYCGNYCYLLAVTASIDSH